MFQISKETRIRKCNFGVVFHSRLVIENTKFLVLSNFTSVVTKFIKYIFYIHEKINEIPGAVKMKTNPLK